MRLLMLLGSIFLLASCCDTTYVSTGWYMNHDRYAEIKNTDDSFARYEIMNRLQKEDEKACGVKSFDISEDVKANLCLESKGWHLSIGPVCE